MGTITAEDHPLGKYPVNKIQLNNLCKMDKKRPLHSIKYSLSSKSGPCALDHLRLFIAFSISVKDIS